MNLNMKNDQTCRLASELALLTGETQTGAVTVALREWREREPLLFKDDDFARANIRSALPANGNADA